jgi:hypothetical protein
MRRFSLFLSLVVALGLSACAHQEPSRQEKFLAAAPRSILVVPVVNKSIDVTAADYMLSAASVPLAEHGFYVFPVNLVKRMLEDDGLSDSSLVHSSSTTKLAALFGADAVLYITIERWDAKYAVTSTTLTVGASYEIRDAKTNSVIWENKAQAVHQSNGGGGGGGGGVAGLLAGLVVKAVSAAVTKAAPDYMPLARQVSYQALHPYPGNGIPSGPYAPVAKN